MTTPAARLRGGAVGVVTAVTAVAAHGMAGGGYPHNAALTFLVLVAIAVGALAGLSNNPKPTAVVLFGGQMLAHVALGISATTEMGHSHQLVPSASMLGFHCAASLVAGLLITIAERLYGPITSVVRAVLRPLHTLPEVMRAELPSARTTWLPSTDTAVEPISRRGPPVCAI